MTEAAARGPAGRIGQIDAMRAVAALLVLVTHATEVFHHPAMQVGGTTWLYRVAHAVDFGRMGVVLFFLISGYVIAHTLAKPASTVGRFAVRRFFRLFPLYWLSVVGACALLAPGPFDPARLAANLTMLPTLFGHEAYLGVYWTLEAELLFYAIAVMLLVGGRLADERALLGVLAASIAAFAAMMFGLLPAPANLAWKSFPLNLAFMLVGMMFHANGSRLARQPLLWGAIALSLAPSAYAFMRYLAAGSPDDLRWGLAYPAAVLVFFWMFTRQGAPRWLVALGALSYSTYLLHTFALALMTANHDHARAWVRMLGTEGAVVVATIASLLLAAIAYRWVEQPFNTFARKVTSRPAAAGAPAVAP